MRSMRFFSVRNHADMKIRQASHASRSELLIGISIGSTEQHFPAQFAALGAKTLLLRRVILNELGKKSGGNDNVGDVAKIITTMSPQGITELAKSIIDKTKISSIVFPGSTNTISELFWKSGVSFFGKPDIRTANSILKMAMTMHSLELGMPTIYSCDASHYPVIALGGKVKETPSYEGTRINSSAIQHNATYATHHVIVKKGTWLSGMAEKVTTRRDKDGNIVLTNVASTHPLIPDELPCGFKVLAIAPDNSPSIFAVTPYALGIVDHPEAYSPMEMDHSPQTQHDQISDPDSDSDGRRLWKKIAQSFVHAAVLQNKHPVHQGLFSLRIQEIISAKNWTELSTETFSVNKSLDPSNKCITYR